MGEPMYVKRENLDFTCSSKRTTDEIYMHKMNSIYDKALKDVARCDHKDFRNFQKNREKIIELKRTLGERYAQQDTPQKRHALYLSVFNGFKTQRRKNVPTIWDSVHP